MWSFRMKSLFFAGILLSFFVFVLITGASLIASNTNFFPNQLSSLLPGHFVVHHQDRTGPAKAFETNPAPLAAGLSDFRLLIGLFDRQEAISAVIPFSVGQVVLRGDLPELAPLASLYCLGLHPDFPERSRSLYAVEQGDVDKKGGSILVAQEFAKRRDIFPRQPIAPGAQFFLDRPGSSDNLNLTAVNVAGTFSLAGGEKAGPSAVCLVDQITLLRATWLYAGDFAGPSFSKETSPLPFVAPGTKGNTLSHQFLFSLGTPVTEVETGETLLAPQFLLIILKPAAIPHAGDYLNTFKTMLLAQPTKAAISLWDPRALSIFPQGVTTFAAIMGGALILLVVLASLIQNPVFKDNTLALVRKNPELRSLVRGSFLRQSFFSGLTFGFIGLAWALIALILYNRLAPPGLVDLVTLVTGVRAETILPSWWGMAAAGLAVLVFVLAGPIGPRRRFTKLLQENAPQSKTGRPTPEENQEP